MESIGSQRSSPSPFTSNEVYMWGRGSLGQLGTGEKKKVKRPTKIKGLSSIGILSFSTGGTHSAGVTAAGDVYVWGSGEEGCLGRGDHAKLAVPRKLLLSGGFRISSVACGSQHTCFLSFDSQIFTVGSNSFGQLGHGNFTSCTIPKPVELPAGENVKKIFCGNHQTAFINQTGQLFTWGNSKSAQLGHGFFFPQTTPKRIEALQEISFSDIRFGSAHAVALSRGGSVYVWGKTTYPIESNEIPTQIQSFIGTRINQVQTGQYHVAVLTSSGNVLTWGCGLHGQLGLGDKEDRNSPWVVKSLCPYKITRICCGAFHTMALSDCGELFSWGDNQKFSCGHSPEKNSITEPGIINLSFSSCIQLVAGGLSTGVLIRPEEKKLEYFEVPLLSNGPRPPKELEATRKLKVFVGTWNINAKTDLNFSNWIEERVKADIIAIGFQELIQLNSHSLAQDEAKSQFASKTHLVRDTVCRFWGHQLESALNCADEDYSLLRDVRLAGVYLAVFIKSHLRSRVTDIDSSTSKVGVLGKLGNKGGVGVRFSIFNRPENSFCFVNCHLAAGLAHIDKRNEDYLNIISSLSFKGANKEKYTVLDHQNIFWFGDLNYRLVCPREQAIALVKAQNWEDLTTFDQLIKERQESRVFEGFTETPIYFAPSYKYDPGTASTFDTSEKCRCPSYCDRVLFRGNDIIPLLYRSHMKCVESDHKPVSAWFDITMIEGEDMAQRLSRLSTIPTNSTMVLTAGETSQLSPVQSVYRKRAELSEEKETAEKRSSPNTPKWKRIKPKNALSAVADKRKDLNGGISKIRGTFKTK